MTKKIGEEPGIPPTGGQPSFGKQKQGTEKVSSSIFSQVPLVEEWSHDVTIFHPEKGVPKWELEAETHPEFGPVSWGPDPDAPHYAEESEITFEEPEISSEKPKTEKENAQPRNGNSMITINSIAYTVFLYMIKPMFG